MLSDLALAELAKRGPRKKETPEELARVKRRFALFEEWHSAARAGDLARFKRAWDEWNEAHAREQ